MRTQAFVILSAALLACGGDPSAVCGGGRTLVAGTCLQDAADKLAPVALASPIGGRFAEPVDVEIHAGEAATIFYARGGRTPTTGSPSGPSPWRVEGVDGELRFFAVDAAGNVQAVHSSERYAVDQRGPNVAALEVYPPDVSGAVLVSWSLPNVPDFDSVLVVRDKHDPPSWTPTRGTRHETGDRVAPQVEVVHAGVSASALDSAPAGAVSYYHAWGMDDLGNYAAEPATAAHSGPLRPNSATLAISLTNRTVSVVVPPFDFGLSVTGEFDAASDTIALALTVSNRVGRPVANMKVYIESTSSGTVVAGSLGASAEPLVHLGLQPTSPDASLSGAFSIVGAQPFPDPLLVQLRLRADPSFIVPGEHFNGLGGGMVVDSGEPSFTQPIACDALINPASVGTGRCALYSWVWGPGFQLIYAGSRNTPWLAVIDPTTWTATVGVALASVGHVPRVVMSGDGQTLWALVVSGAHRRPFNAVVPIDIDLVSLDRESLVELSRVRLASAVPPGTPRGGDLVVSPDGTRAAAIVRGVEQAFMVDLIGRTSAAVPLPASPLALAMSPSGEAVYVGFDVPAFVLQIDVATLGKSTLNVSGGRASALLAVGNDVFVAAKGSNPGLHVYDVSTGVTATLFPGESMSALVLSADGASIEVVSRDLFVVNRVALSTLQPFGSVQLPGFPRGHHIAVTP